MTGIIKLPAVQKDLGFPLMKALENRRSKRKWGDSPLSEQELSNLLWAACGINQEETKKSKSKRTAPSATNSQAIKVYVALENGLFLYEENEHSLVPVLAKDIRKYLCNQKMLQSAPVGLIFVSDYSKMKMYFKSDDQLKWFFSGSEASYISQNVYLYCASARLNTVVIALVNREQLHEMMGLKDHEKVVFTQVVGKSPDG